MVSCPQCKGTKERRLLVCGWGERISPCPFCAGLGAVSQGKAKLWRTGETKRRDRIARGLSLKEEAARLGVSARELGDREWGRVA